MLVYAWASIAQLLRKITASSADDDIVGGHTFSITIIISCFHFQNESMNLYYLTCHFSAVLLLG